MNPPGAAGTDPRARYRLAGAAAHAFENAEKERRIEVRVPLPQEAATRFPGTQGALEAGDAVREELLGISEQRIRVSKGFLLENPVMPTKL